MAVSFTFSRNGTSLIASGAAFVALSVLLSSVSVELASAGRKQSCCRKGDRNCEAKPVNSNPNSSLCGCKKNYVKEGGMCKADNGGRCKQETDCRKGLKCRPLRQNSSYWACVCDRSSFWYYQENTCRNVTLLRVVVDKFERTTRRVTFFWRANGYELHPTYSIRWGNSKSERVTGSPSTINNLQPGGTYTFDFVTHFSEPPLYQRETKLQRSITLKPGKPGQVNRGTSQLNSNPMLLRFGRSRGKVSKYEIILTTGSGEQKRNTTSNYTEFNLLHGVTYGYTIFALNGKNDRSKPRQGLFTTEAVASYPVTRLNTSSVTSGTVTVTWGMPEHPNGNISTFVFRIFKMPKGDVINETRVMLSANDLQNHGDFSHQFTSLSPYTQYKLVVYAVNEAGNGNKRLLKFRTSEDIASNIRLVNVTPGIDKKASQVYLHVQLIPGDQTGETNYSVILLDDMYKRHLLIKYLTGYSNTNVTLPDLLANHKYVVSAYAQTHKGRSPNDTISKLVTTYVNRPGKAIDVKVTSDDIIATKFVLTLKCPSKDERNGTITSVRIEKNLNGSNTEYYNFTVSKQNCSLKLNSTNLGSFKVLHNYSFRVVLRNEVFESDPSDSVFFYATAKPPTFRKENKLIKKTANTVSSDSKIQIAVCVSCLLDESQGRVTTYGLIVCVKSDENVCNENKKTTMSHRYATWAEARAVGFSIPYKLLLNSSLPTNPSVNFTIGLDSDCSEDVDIKEYCNGPLPDGKEVVVKAFSCTSGGCAKTEPFIAKTSTLNDGGFGVVLMVAVAAGAGAFSFIVVAVVVILIRRRRKRTRTPELIEVQRKDKEDSEKIKRHNIPIRQLKEAVARFKKDSNLLFQEQFEDINALSLLVDATTHEARKETNKAKNRYADILPYDHSRVKLQVQSDSDDSTDYINANYIPGFNSDTDYIATQGPMHATIPHLWRMVWEHECTAIVMLSGLTENNKLKVNPYWPEILNEPIVYGEILVEMTKFSHSGDTIIKTFRISLGDQSRFVTHFFLQGWSDFSADVISSDVIGFVQLVRTTVIDEESSAPIVVHCSAGVGRTGTFIAVDYFMQYIEEKGLDADVDIFGYAMTMRRNRPRMVQALSQYVFIHDTLLEVIEKKLKEEEAEHMYSNTMAQEDCVYFNALPSSQEHTYSNMGLVDSENPL